MKSPACPTLLFAMLAWSVLGITGQTAPAAPSDTPATIIRGRVLDEARRPAPYVWVQVQTLDPTAAPDLRTGGWALASTNSDADGEFALSVDRLPPTWTLLALQGENVAWHEHTLSIDPPGARPITLDLRPWPRINGLIRALDESLLGYSVAIEVESTATRAIPALASVPASVAIGGELKPGLVAEVFLISDSLGDGSRILDDAWFTRTPLFRRIESQISYRQAPRFGETGLAADFAVRWSGIIRIPTAGEYTLSVLSDDGVRIVIDGHPPVLYDDGVHAARLASKNVQLAAGDHELLVEYFQGGYSPSSRLAIRPLAREQDPAEFSDTL